VPPDPELPDCLNKECIEEYDLDILRWKILKVLMVQGGPYAQSSKILTPHDHEARAEVDLFLTRLIEQVQNTPKKKCEGDCKCLAHLYYTARMRGLRKQKLLSPSRPRMGTDLRQPLNTGINWELRKADADFRRSGNRR
jgi:hypothetical protein